MANAYTTKGKERLEGEVLKEKLADPEKKIESHADKIDKKIDFFEKDFYHSAREHDTFEVKEYNAVFRQMASQLILIAGILLALSTQFGNVLTHSTAIVKTLSLIVVTSLNLSIVFGVLQHLIEANFFKQGVLERRALLDAANFDNPKTIIEYYAAFREFKNIHGSGAKRWPTYVQITLLGIAMVLISVVVGLQMYGY